MYLVVALLCFCLSVITEPMKMVMGGIIFLGFITLALGSMVSPFRLCVEVQGEPLPFLIWVFLIRIFLDREEAVTSLVSKTTFSVQVISLNSIKPLIMRNQESGYIVIEIKGIKNTMFVASSCHPLGSVVERLTLPSWPLKRGLGQFLWNSSLMHCEYLSPQTKKYADVIIPRGADNLGESWSGQGVGGYPLGHNFYPMSVVLWDRMWWPSKAPWMWLNHWSSIGIQKGIFAYTFGLGNRPLCIRVYGPGDKTGIRASLAESRGLETLLCCPSQQWHFGALHPRPPFSKSTFSS